MMPVAQSSSISTKSKLLFSLIIFMISTCLFELGYRQYLFSNWSEGTQLRQPGLYADPQSENDYWILHSKWRDASVDFTIHSELGWIGNFRPQSLRHFDAVQMRGRRPILLFGDSFSACVEGVECFESLLEGSDFGEDYAILNYGVGGYGLDQIWMLMERVLPLYPDAIVIIGVMSDDVDRAHLSMREASKPMFQVVDDTLLLKHRVSDPVDLSLTSFVFRRVLFSSACSPRFRSWILDENRSQQVKRDRATHILKEMESLTSERQRLAIVFDPMRSNSMLWQTEFLKTFWSENDVPMISSWDLLQEAEFGSSPNKWIGDDGHPTTTQNQLILDEILLRLHRW